jgi:cardiolipin synthase
MRHQRILAGILIVLIVIGTVLLFAQDPQTLRIKSSLSVEDPRFPQYLADLLGHQLTAGDSYVVHTNGDDAFPAMLDAIDRARERISLEMYIYEKSDIGTRFTNALEASARRGVQVRMVLDSMGSKRIAHDDVKRLQDAGVRIGWVNPLLSYHVEAVNYRTHRKELIVDGTVAFVGGLGIADQWARETKDEPMWRDTEIEMRGPVVVDVESAFNQNWMVTGGVVDPVVRPIETTASGSSRSIAVWSARQDGANDLKLLYLLAIGAARHSIDIESPYLITDTSTHWSLREARQRGVRVRMLVEGDRTDAKSVKYAGRSHYETLLAEGVEIAEYQPAMLHAKAMIIDGELSVVGSANFDNRSLEMNEELNVAVFDRALATRLREDFDRDLTRARPLDLDGWRSRFVGARARDWVWGYFGEVF